ncbi:MAG: alcohol dehydrogenase catalytic domain-containing protein [Ruminiclostridium sp.]
METMLAAVFEKEGVFTLKTIPVPEIKDEDQILLKVLAVSICGTDVHITAVPPGYIAKPNTVLGHEFVGEVVKKGSEVSHLDIGDRVVVNPNDYCGVCTYCRKNMPNECEKIIPLGIEYDGAFTKYCLVSSKVAYKISKDVPVEVAACTEPLACAINGLNKVNMKPGENAVIIGCGPIGVMLAMLAKASGISNIYLLETMPYRIEFTRSLNIGRVIDVKNENAKDIIYGDTEIGADYVFDVTGSQMTPSIDLVRKGGKVVLFGVNKKSVSQIAQSEITTKEISVLGTWLANATFPEAVKVIEKNAIDLSKLITDIIPLEKVHEGIEKLVKGEAVKVVVKP